MALALCPSCSRHVRLPSLDCPFCGEAIASAEGSEGSRGRLSRAAMVFGAIAISASAAACSKETIAQPYGAPPQPPPQEDAGGAVVTLYGAPPDTPPPPPSATATTPPTAIVAPYGAPPDYPKPDAGAPKPKK